MKDSSDSLSRGLAKWRVARAVVTGLVIPAVFLASCSSGSSGKPRVTGSPATTGPRGPTAFGAAAKNGGQVELTWSAASGEGITGYTIYRDGSVLKFVSPTLATYVDITVQPKHTYHYEIESVTSAGRSPRVAAGEVTTPAPPAVSLAQVNGSYRLLGRIVSENFTNARKGERWERFWGFFPVCSSSTACDVKTMGDGDRDATLKRSGASYSGKIVLKRHAICGSARIDEIDTVRFKVSRAEFIKGVWTSTRMRGTVRQETPASHGCLYGYASIEFTATHIGP